jgi:hypothetical protein
MEQGNRLDSLRRFISDEIYKALGLSSSGWYSKLLQPLFHIPASRFAKLGAKFDTWVAETGLVEAARRLLPDFISDLTIRGGEHIPQEGPLLIASNHPGTYDSLVIAANLPRSDLRIISSDIPFLAGLPAAKRHIIFTTLDAHVRMAALRASLRHLQEGGALLLFPSGHIDPDPEVLPGAAENLGEWSRSLELLLRRVPDTNILITIVSGVLARTCTRNPLTRLRSKPVDRQRLAEFIQIIQQMVFGREFNLVPNLTFGELTSLEKLQQRAGRAFVLDEIILRARLLLQEHLPIALSRAPAG